MFNFIEIDGTKVGHNILIVGYTEEGNYIYIDPNYSDKEFECSPDYLNSKNASKYDFEIKKIGKHSVTPCGDKCTNKP